MLKAGEPKPGNRRRVQGREQIGRIPWGASFYESPPSCLSTPMKGRLRYISWWSRP